MLWLPNSPVRRSPSVLQMGLPFIETTMPSVEECSCRRSYFWFTAFSTVFLARVLRDEFICSVLPGLALFRTPTQKWGQWPIYLHRPDDHRYNKQTFALRTTQTIGKSEEMSSKMDRPVQRFGEIPGAPVGTTWKNRKECFDAGVHRQIEAGISGTEADGAYSIVVSGQYKDDKDNGDKILYTGSGGRDNNTGELNRDQEWSNFGNQALRKSSETGEPVRVIRGHELDSEYAPWEGFRYDGLYICKRAWKEKDADGYYDICRYDLERVPGQPSLRRRLTVGRYRPLPDSEAVQPPTPTPAPVNGRQRIRQQEQASLDKDASFLGVPL